MLPNFDRTIVLGKEESLSTSCVIRMPMIMCLCLFDKHLSREEGISTVLVTASLLHEFSIPVSKRVCVCVCVCVWRLFSDKEQFPVIN